MAGTGSCAKNRAGGAEQSKGRESASTAILVSSRELSREYCSDRVPLIFRARKEQTEDSEESTTTDKRSAASIETPAVDHPHTATVFGVSSI